MYDDGPIWLRRGGQHAMDAKILRERWPRIAPKRKPTQRSADEEKTLENQNMGEIDDMRKAQVELEGFFQNAGTHDPVQRPAHYQHFGVEVIDIIRHALGPEGFRSYCIGNELKYRLRAGDKGDAAQDLAKAMKYREFRETK